MLIMALECRRGCWYVYLLKRLIANNLGRQFQIARSHWLLQELADGVVSSELKKKRSFRKFSYRGIELDQCVYLRTNQDPPATLL